MSKYDIKTDEQLIQELRAGDVAIMDYIMNKYKTLASNTALISLGTFGSKLLVFLMVRFYTGYLTTTEYGTADLIQQTANLLLPIISIGITDGVFRFAEFCDPVCDVFGILTVLYSIRSRNPYHMGRGADAFDGAGDGDTRYGMRHYHFIADYQVP